MMALPRAEYPRPQFERPDWLNLNGVWSFEFDDEDRGLREQWFANSHFTRQITVPFPFQSRLSGIADTRFHDVVWYQREFALPEAWAGRRILLHFGAVDYRAWVWVNNVLVASHEGGHTPFSAEITHVLKDGANSVVVRVEDLSTDLEQPRGKQFWEEQSKGIFYTRTTGIWQTVWLEPAGRAFIERVQWTPDVDQGEVRLEYWLDSGTAEQQLEVEIVYAGQQVAKAERSVETLPEKATFSLALDGFDEQHCWSPEHPNLYDAVLRLKAGGQVLDEVKSYFGMRKISVEGGKVLLNNLPYMMKLVLDQGYFPEGILTAPSDDELRRDVEFTKAMGFNGARKHQKVEDPRYLYWADRLGLLVWGEMANCYTYSPKSVRRVTAEWQAAVERDYNHPCVVAWVPINESWGVPQLATDSRQPNHGLALYHLTKSLDPTRPVISNDGWEHTRSDLCTIHDYAGDKETLKSRYGQTVEKALEARPANRLIYVPGFAHSGEPILISEFGGIAYQKGAWEGWGYTAAASDADFIERYYAVVSALLECPLVQGFCYTQLTDVEQEINGLLTYDRQSKVDPAIIRAINEGQTLETAMKR